MPKTRALLTLKIWNSLVIRGLVKEPESTPGLPNTGIECPSINPINKRACKAHLWDLQIRCWYDGYKSVGCGVCGWSGKARIGKRTPNGKA